MTAKYSGAVKWYDPAKGFGFISVEGGEEVWVHRTSLSCKRLFPGEEVSFELLETERGRQAWNVQRRSPSTQESQRLSGDVVEWKVDQITRTSAGLLQAETGERFRFSPADIVAKKDSHFQTRPRPWHAATFRVVDTQEGRRATDVELDTRYPLQRFAYLGSEQKLIADLKYAALKEHWDYRESHSRYRNQILYNYLHFTFARLCDEDRESSGAAKKIRIVKGVDGQSSLATFNTGLVDKRYEPIFALFEENKRNRPLWRFLSFCIPGEGHGKLLARYFNPLPEPAQYFTSTSEFLYDPDAPLHVDINHVLCDNRDRLPQALLEGAVGLAEERVYTHLKMHLDRAIDVARRRARWNYKTAIPHYFPTFKRLEFLLPLCLVDDSRVDVALAVQRTETGYQGDTILKLDWAYKSARLVCRPDSDWLAPQEIAVSEEGEPGEDFF